MAVSFRNHSRGLGCQALTVDLDNEGKIGSSVGAGGANNARDVRTVQCLLNGIGPLEGGPGEMLDVDGIVGPFTLGAINRFQSFHFGWNDGRVDTNGKTIALLREPPATSPSFAAGGSGQAPPAAAPKNPLPNPPGNFNKVEVYSRRLQTAVSVLPEAKAAVENALQRLSFAALMAQQSTFGSDHVALAHVNKHFRTSAKHSAGLVQDLRSIEHVYRLMRVVMNARVSSFGGSPWGMFIFDIDRFPNLNRKAAAYTGLGAMHLPSSKVDRRYNHPIMGSTVYLCDLADSQARDSWIIMVIHEIAHMVGSTHAGAGIDDFGYGWEPRYNGLGKWHRTHNAENYAVYAFESKFGTKRLYDQIPNEAFLIAPIVDSNGGLKN